MSKKTNKPLLNEGTVRRMMKLAEIDSLSSEFVTRNYVAEEEENLEESEEVVAEEEEMEAEMDVEEEGPMDAEDVEKEDEEEEKAEEADEEVSITDEEAQDIIDLADKLKAAMEGGADEEEGEEEVDMDMDMGGEEAEMDMDMEEPGMRDMMEEELYEAALRGLDIEVVDDKAEQREALMNEAKARIYERVIKRLLKESKK